MFCSKCGNEIADEAILCPKCGCPTANYQPITKSNCAYSQDYVALKEFEDKVKSIYVVSIIALCLLLGIGLIFSFAVWIKAKAIRVPSITTQRPNEIAMFDSAKRKLKRALEFANAPLYVLIIPMIALFSTGMFGPAILIFVLYIAIIFFAFPCTKHLNRYLYPAK